MVALFAIGVITDTILSFEMGLLRPNFTATFGSVFGLGFAIEGFSFFMEAIFIGIYVYGWDRLSPRMHFASGIPVAFALAVAVIIAGWLAQQPILLPGLTVQQAAASHDTLVLAVVAVIIGGAMVGRMLSGPVSAWLHRPRLHRRAPANIALDQ